MFRSASEKVESCLLEMHDVDWGRQEGAAMVQTSPYIRHVADFLQRFRSEYLAHFVPQPSPNLVSFATLLCQRLASRTITFFVRQACMIKPLGQPGKLQLAKVRIQGLLKQFVYTCKQIVHGDELLDVKEPSSCNGERCMQASLPGFLCDQHV
jgi:hypothetical protein